MPKEKDNNKRELQSVVAELRRLNSQQQDNSEIVSAVESLHTTMRVDKMAEVERIKNQPVGVGVGVDGKTSVGDGQLNGIINAQEDFRRRFKAGRAGSLFDNMLFDKTTEGSAGQSQSAPVPVSIPSPLIVEHSQADWDKIATITNIQLNQLKTLNSMKVTLTKVAECVCSTAKWTEVNSRVQKKWFTLEKNKGIAAIESKREKNVTPLSLSLATGVGAAAGMGVSKQVNEDEDSNEDSGGYSLLEGVVAGGILAKLASIRKLPGAIFAKISAIGNKLFGKFTGSKGGAKYAKYLKNPRTWPLIIGAMVLTNLGIGLTDIFGASDKPTGDQHPGTGDEQLTTGDKVFSAANTTLNAYTGVWAAKWLSKKSFVKKMLSWGTRVLSKTGFGLRVVNIMTKLGPLAANPYVWAGVLAGSLLWEFRQPLIDMVDEFANPKELSIDQQILEAVGGKWNIGASGRTGVSNNKLRKERMKKLIASAQTEADMEILKSTLMGATGWTAKDFEDVGLKGFVNDELRVKTLDKVYKGIYDSDTDWQYKGRQKGFMNKIREKKRGDLDSVMWGSEMPTFMPSINNSNNKSDVTNLFIINKQAGTNATQTLIESIVNMSVSDRVLPLR